ncbi:hypothetical protein D3C86_1805020 [compost metagenome]
MPHRQDLERVRQVVLEVVEEDVTETPAEDHAHDEGHDEVGHVALGHGDATALHLGLDDEVGKQEAQAVHHAVPVDPQGTQGMAGHVEGAELEGNRIERWKLQHGFSLPRRKGAVRS